MSVNEGFRYIAEINPPELPGDAHRELDGRWRHVLITDNIFGRIRVSPYAYGARITHDVPSVQPTVVVSTRDRNILAIESEVRGALGNGVSSFLVVVGDTRPEVDHLSDHHEIVEHLRALQDRMPPFEVGMPTRLRKWHYRKRIDLGAQFLVAGPIIDPSTVRASLDRLDRQPEDPPLYLMVHPPFSANWIERGESFGCVPASEELKATLRGLDRNDARRLGWEQAQTTAVEAETAGCSGVILTGCSENTILTEAPKWRVRSNPANAINVGGAQH